MFRYLCMTAVIGSAALNAQEDLSSSPSHSLSPKAYYVKHKEWGYKYKFIGAGIEYLHERPMGPNFRIFGFSDLKRDFKFFQFSPHFSYFLPINSWLTVFPLFSGSICSHHLSRADHKDLYVSKSVFYLGGGSQFKVADFRINAECQLFHDLQNILVVQEKNDFWGREYYNPSGFRIGLRVFKPLIENLNFDLGGHFAKTFDNCYRQYGFEAALRWRI